MFLNILHVEYSLFVVSLIQIVLADDDSEEVGAFVAERVNDLKFHSRKNSTNSQNHTELESY